MSCMRLLFALIKYNSFKDILVRIAVICTSRLLEFAACKFGKIWDKTYSEEASAEDFIINVIRRYPSAMEEADDFGWIPLHNAAHMGHTRADNRGRSALHFAVDSGNTSVVDYILRTRILDCTINKQDNEGNTPFHLAAGKGNYTVLLMLAKDSRVDKGATNKRGLAAIDIINSKMDLRHYKKSWIGQKLEMAGGQPSLESIHYKRLGQLKMTVANYEAENITVANGGGNTAEVNEKKSVLTNGNSEEAEINFMYERFKDISNISILTATIIATVTFAAGFTMPSGYKNEDGTGQSMAVLSRRVAIIAFVIANTLAFCCSTASLLIHFWASLEKHHGTNVYFIKRARTFTYCSIISMVAAFISGTNVVLDGSSGLAIASLVICCSFLVAQSFLVLK
ncbi:Ankyrin repeat-containing protein [Quillaja saponaria]|uniref:Ankyrin repeat-containing protein n=1 Tax=Quillaja saponaria TaxID=32244 RepID=A0AAD7VH97_QUISA|nr:Ankyrin repeat-containing protein [Quillaja saponaria]